jgi:hypothetical protein
MIIYMTSILCLCHAFAAGYLSIYLSLVLWICATPCCVVCVVVPCVLVLLFTCGPCLRAGWGIIVRLTISVVGSSHRGHNAEHSSYPHV